MEEENVSQEIVFSGGLTLNLAEIFGGKEEENGE
jgi:hypothetical protein